MRPLLLADNLAEGDLMKTTTSLYDVAEQSPNTEEHWKPIWKPASRRLMEDAVLHCKLWGDIARAQGMTQVPEIRGFSRESLLQGPLSGRAQPGALDTILRVVNGLPRLKVDAGVRSEVEVLELC